MHFLCQCVKIREYSVVQCSHQFDTATLNIIIEDRYRASFCSTIVAYLFFLSMLTYQFIITSKHIFAKFSLFIIGNCQK